MGHYLITKMETCQIRKKSFEGQLDRFLKIVIASADNPNQALAIVPLFGKIDGSGFTEIINKVHQYEQETSLNEKLPIQIDGEFEEVQSKHGALCREFTADEAKYGICNANDVGKVERTSDKKVRIYKSIRVFTRYNIISGIKIYIPGWSREKMYYKYYGYNYFKLSDLTEPLQL